MEEVKERKKERRQAKMTFMEGCMPLHASKERKIVTCQLPVAFGGTLDLFFSLMSQFRVAFRVVCGVGAFQKMAAQDPSPCCWPCFAAAALLFPLPSTRSKSS